jgi:lipid II:glycine glycyltransferase (peptidoglycan interpeptide bridge formation enzyme)
MILSKRMSVTIADLYFDEALPSGIKLDIVRFNQWPRLVEGATCIPFSTIVLDLSLSTQELLSKMNRATRYQIRRASEKDRLVYEFSNSGHVDMATKFADHFDRCAGLKNLAKASRKRLFILARIGALDVSFVCDNRGEILAATSYIMTPGRARVLYTGAAFRATTDHTRRTVIGRANRYLYWRDILRFKEAGVRIFDFGGYYTGSEDQEKLRVNSFKEGFGGQVLQEYNCRKAVTLKGKAALWAIQGRAHWYLRKRAATTRRSTGDGTHESSVPASL